MVAISLYRGNLHRVPDAPRRWLMPTRSISLRVFKSLLTRRSRALSRITSSDATTSNPNPNPDLVATSLDRKEGRIPPPVEPQPKGEKGASTSNPNPLLIATSLDRKQGRIPPPVEPQSKGEKGGSTRHFDADGDGGACARTGEALKEEGPCRNCSTKPDDVPTRLDVENAQMAEKRAVDVLNANGDLQGGKPDESAEPKPEAKGNAELSDEKAKRKKEVEERLEILNAKKHTLVQVLKQLLNVEEELKRRSSMPTMATRPSGPLQVDIPNDSGSTIRHLTPRLGSETNFRTDVEGLETEDVSNPNAHSRQIQRMSSISPSSESPLRRPPPPYNVVPHHPRSSLVATSSPSRFAPMGQQGHPANQPTVSLSGTNYIPSSPSPAASGGTSAFRDARQPSPWN